MMPQRSTVASLAISAAYAILIVLLYFLSPGSSAVFVYQGF
jgi:hypothetical protein